MLEFLSQCIGLENYVEILVTVYRRRKLCWILVTVNRLRKL